jgi:hypothetical protein
VSPLTPTPELTAAIEALYKTFAAYPLRDYTGACQCHHTLEEERRLHNTALRQLSADQLRDYAMDAIWTWGDCDDFRHFLPRVFELLVFAEDYTFTDREIVLSKLYHGEWRSWPAEEQKAVQEFLLAVLHLVLETPPPADDPNDARELDSWLCAIAGTEGDLEPFFTTWLEAPSAAAAWNLAVLITRMGYSLPHVRGQNAFWAGHRRQLERIRDWLRSAEVRKKLGSAMETFINEPCSEELFSALNLLS